MQQKMDLERIFYTLQNGNDVRGVAVESDLGPVTLTPSLAAFIASAFADYVAKVAGKERGQLRIGVGHDSRMSADAMMEGCKKGLSDVLVYDCGLCSTPSMFQSTIYSESGFDGSIMLTASHLPFNRNGMKFFTPEGGLEHDALTGVLKEAIALAEQYGEPDEKQIISAGNLPAGEGKSEAFALTDVYADHMRQYIIDQVKAQDEAHPLQGLHIVLDAGNGAAGFFAEKILAPLGADTSGSVFLDPDGTFPNHVPNPENGAAMDAIRKATLKAKADLGVIFDCDGDRGAVVFSDGMEVNRNRLIALLSKIVAKDYPGSTVVTDSVTSDELHEFLEENLGLVHLRYQRGYKNVINKGIECNQKGEVCQLAIETSGHGAFKDNYFSDDGAYISIKIICEMAKLRREGKSLESLLEGFTEPAEATEKRYLITDPQEGDADQRDYKAYGKQVIEDFEAFAKKNGYEVVSPNYEGVRVSFDDEEVKGWILVRQSLHDPEIPVNIESKREGGLAVILSRMEPFFGEYGRLRVK